MGPGVFESFRKVAAVHLSQECCKGFVNRVTEGVFAYCCFCHTWQVEPSLNYISASVVSVNQRREAVGHRSDELGVS